MAHHDALDHTPGQRRRELDAGVREGAPERDHGETIADAAAEGDSPPWRMSACCRAFSKGFFYKPTLLVIVVRQIQCRHLRPLSKLCRTIRIRLAGQLAIEQL